MSEIIQSQVSPACDPGELLVRRRLLADGRYMLFFTFARATSESIEHANGTTHRDPDQTDKE
jgi:hypothetical protein